MSFEAGVVAGHRVLVHVVGVPGERALLLRRETLLGQADAVVFVVDPTEPGLAAAQQALRSLELPDRGPPDVLLVWGDGAAAGSAAERLGLPSPAVVGVGEEGDQALLRAFLLAVRAAAARVSPLLVGRELADLPPTPGVLDLLEMVRRVPFVRAAPGSANHPPPMPEPGLASTATSSPAAIHEIHKVVGGGGILLEEPGGVFRLEGRSGLLLRAIECSEALAGEPDDVVLRRCAEFEASLESMSPPRTFHAAARRGARLWVWRGTRGAAPLSEVVEASRRGSDRQLVPTLLAAFLSLVRPLRPEGRTESAPRIAADAFGVLDGRIVYVGPFVESGLSDAPGQLRRAWRSLAPSASDEDLQRLLATTGRKAE